MGYTDFISELWTLDMNFNAKYRRIVSVNVCGLTRLK